MASQGIAAWLVCVTLSSCGATAQAGPSSAQEPVPPEPSAPGNPGRTAASVLGVVLNERSRQIGGATVRVTGGPDAGQATRADVDGLYRFDALAVGSSATITVSAPGYREGSRTILVERLGNTLHFTLADADLAEPPVGSSGSSRF